MTELVKYYRRLRDTMSKNDLPTGFHTYQGLVPRLTVHRRFVFKRYFSAVFGLLHICGGNPATWCCVARWHDLLGDNSSTSSHPLESPCRTVASYVSIGGIKAAGENRVAREFCIDYERQHLQLFLRKAPRSGV